MITREKLIAIGPEKLADILLSLYETQKDMRKQLDIIFAERFMIEVVLYNPEWPHLFEEEAELIRRALGKNCIEERLALDRQQSELITQDMENYAQVLKKKTLDWGGAVIDSSNKSIAEVVQTLEDLIFKQAEERKNAGGASQ